jgi:1-phosphofructokinase
MIYTLTLNPSVDYFLHIQDFKEGDLNLSTYSNILSGGKGINVSMVLANLQVKSTALGFIGGFVGEQIVQTLKHNKIANDFIHLNENTRINIKLYNKSSKIETEIAGFSPNILAIQEVQLINKISSIVKAGDILVLSGSIPSTVQKDIYKIISQKLHLGTKVVLDTRGTSLKENLHNNFLIKPNIKELTEMFGKSLTNHEEIIDSCNYFFDIGVENVMVSMGKDGSLLLNKSSIYRALPIKLEVNNSVGAGDSMVAGFVYGTYINKSLVESYKLSVASSCATISSGGFAKEETIKKFINQIEIEQIK